MKRNIPMHRTKIIIAAAALFAVLIIIILGYSGQKDKGQEYILDKNNKIKLSDVQTYYEYRDFDEEDVRYYFKDDIVNKYTLKFFMHMDELFNNSTGLEDNLEKARQYLDSIMPPRLADRMLDLYKTYLNYQIGFQKKMKEWELPRTPEEALARLHRLQNYRRSIFGGEDADIIFGAGVKSEEYSIRRSAIVNDKEMYGEEKERKLYTLDNNMWGDEADSMKDRIMPYMRYQEKLRLYQKDLSEMKSDEERQAKMMQLRRDVFNPDQIKQLDDVDRKLAEEKNIRDQYFAREREIQGDSSLGQEEKEKMIYDLQNATFGDGADAFRRGQAIEKGMKQYIK